MTTDAYLRVVCDKCMQAEEEIMLTATAKGWDDRGVDEDIEGLGWTIDKDGGHFCPDCAEDK